MPELPDLTTYLDALAPRVIGQPVEEVRLVHAFLLRTVAPPPGALVGRRIVALRLLGKQLVFEAEGELFMLIHLMIAGRLRWSAAGKKPPLVALLATFRFPTGTLVLTEAGSKRRAALYMVQGRDALAAYDRGGLDVLTAPLEAFATRLRSENHTLKRALTDPRLFAGIGNSYSDEILHRARLSPVTLTSRLSDEAIATLHAATRSTLRDWIARLRAEVGDGFPDKVTAFREGMAVHGRYRLPCPDCGDPVQRIRYAENETNYCATCQTGGKLLADRGLSRLLKSDWPRTVEELELRRTPPGP